jgi:hypothetical protein
MSNQANQPNQNISGSQILPLNGTFTGISSGPFNASTAISISNCTFTSSNSYIVYNSSGAGSFVNGGTLELTIPVFISPDESYYELPDGVLADFPDEVDFDSLDDILAAILEENTEAIAGYGTWDSTEETKFTFKFKITRNGTTETKELVLPYDEFRDMVS